MRKKKKKFDGGGGRVGGGDGSGSVNGSSCEWLQLLFIVDSVYIILL